MHRQRNFFPIFIIMFIILFTACRSNAGRSPQESDPKPEEQRQDYPFDRLLDQGGYDNDNIHPEKIINKNVYLEGTNFGGLKESEAIEKLLDMASGIDVPPRDAVLDEYTWSVLKRGVVGRRVNIAKTLDLLINSPEGRKNNLVIEDVIPEVTSDKLRKNITVIGTYTTHVFDQSPSRMNNIDIASRKLDYEKILPGEEFSFNAALGKRTKGKGYEKAPIFIRTKDGPKKFYDYGGGICQLSTTLYNAAEKGGIRITERHSHSKEVVYAPKGKDATVSYGSSDFKFMNNRDYPIMIRVFFTGKDLTVTFYENSN